MGEALKGGTRWGLSSAAAPCRGRFWDRLLVGLVGVLGAGVALLPSARPAAACGGSGEPLCANIGHSLQSDPQEWETGNPDPLPAGQSTTVYFRALDDLDNPIDNDDDPDLCDGRIVMDEAVYTWYWFYPSTSKSDTGLSQSRNYSYPGKRTVGLFVDDVPGPPGCQNDSAQIDSVVVTLPLTLEMDWMEGYELTLTGMHAVWATGGHKLEIDPDHNTDCEYHPYLGDDVYFEGNGEGFYDYMAEYETEGCDLYLMGIDEWSYQIQPVNGVCPDHRWGLVCVGIGAGLLTQLHECAAHDETLKPTEGFGHCEASPPVPCALHAHALCQPLFCTECQNKMKAEIKAKS